MAHGKAKAIAVDTSWISVQLDPHYREHFQAFLKDNLKKPLSLLLSVKGEVNESRPGAFTLVITDKIKVTLDRHYPARSMLQHRTLRMIEKWIYYADEHKYPKRNDDIFWIHEGLLEEYAPKLKNPDTGLEKPKRSSDLTTAEMAWVINGALTTLASKEIPNSIRHSIDSDMADLWDEMYKWRYSHKDDPFSDKYHTWDEYREAHPVCEFSRKHGTTGDPLVRSHIISAGADGTLYEEPWNWIHCLQSIHQRQHTEGWAAVLESFPHMKEKIQRAKEKGKHKGVPEWQLPTLDSSQKKSSQYPMF